MLINLTLKEFAAEVASSSPAPGGGSVAAYAGVQGFALVAMVTRLTMGREKFAAAEAEMQELQKIASAKLERLAELVDEDTEGFKSVMAALGLPKESEAEKQFRRAELERATLGAAKIPLETASLCLAGLRLLPALLSKGNPNALSDMGVAARLFKAGLDGALYNVRINALGLKSAEPKQDLLRQCQSMLEEGTRLAQEAEDEVLKRLS